MFCVFNILWEFTVYRITCNAKNRTHVRSHSLFLSLSFSLFHCFLSCIVARWTNEMASKKPDRIVRDWMSDRKKRSYCKPGIAARWYAMGKNIETKSREVVKRNSVTYKSFDGTVFSTGIVSRSSRELANFHCFYPPSIYPLCTASSIFSLLSKHLRRTVRYIFVFGIIKWFIK